MERRHLIPAAAALAAVVLISAVSAGAAGKWHVLADGTSRGPSATATTGYVALDRASAARFTAKLPGAGIAKLDKVDFSTNAVVAIFGEFGCTDGRIAVSSIAQHGTALAVKLVVNPLPPGKMECMAIYGTYRLLTVPRSLLARPYPTHAVVAGA